MHSSFLPPIFGLSLKRFGLLKGVHLMWQHHCPCLGTAVPLPSVFDRSLPVMLPFLSHNYLTYERSRSCTTKPDGINKSQSSWCLSDYEQLGFSTPYTAKRAPSNPEVSQDSDDDFFSSSVVGSMMIHSSKNARCWFTEESPNIPGHRHPRSELDV